MPIARSLFVVAFLLGMVLMMPAYANGGLLWERTERQAIISSNRPEVHSVAPNVPSLFVDRAAHSMFAPYSVRTSGRVAVPRVPRVSPGSSRSHRLLDLIASAEAGSAGYDAVVWAARIKPAKPPTQMTVGEIYQWIDDTPNQHHAIGRYQFIPSTLQRLVRASGAGMDQPFNPAYQDQLAHLLLAEAGLDRFETRELGRITFMNNLAKIWAGLPNASGRSHYHGVAGNRATISWAQFYAEMNAIYPKSG